MILSCKESPTSIGDNFILQQDRFNILQHDTLSVSDSTYYDELKPAVTAVSEGLIVGRHNGYVSYGYMLYPIKADDSILTMLQQGKINITNTWVELRQFYYVGSKTDPFDFTINLIKNNIDFNTIDKATYSSVSYDPTDISYSHTINDTLTKFYLDNTTVKNWLLRTSSDSLSYPNNYGIIMVPTAGTNKVVGYHSHQSSTGYAGRIYFAFNKPGVYTDTLAAYVTSDTYHAEINAASANTDKFITLIGGVTYKNSVQFGIPALPTNAVINKATLQLTIDSTQSWLGTYTDSTFADIGSLIDVGRLQAKNSVVFDTTTLKFLTRQSSPNRAIYSGDITPLVQYWINHNDNYGFSLFVSYEDYYATKLVFYGSKNPDVTKRPKLTITYSYKNK